MVKVITYGTFDMLHHGHVRLLERAKSLGDFLIVGVTSDDFDKNRGKINVSQSLMERIENVRSTGLADQIIVEEYDGQKIDDIRRFNVDIFTVGSDWKGKFDYLSEWCKVQYLERTQGISSTELRTNKNKLKLGLVGESLYLKKFLMESSFVNGVEVECVCSSLPNIMSEEIKNVKYVSDNLNDLMDKVDAVFIASHPLKHYEQIKLCLQNKKHVLCEAPSSISYNQYLELRELASTNNCIFIDSVKTAFSTAYSRLLGLVKSGVVGDVISVDATCTSLQNIDFSSPDFEEKNWNSISAWGPTALLPVFNILGSKYVSKNIVSRIAKNSKNFDIFTKIDFIFPKAVASIKVGKGIKSEGDLIISGTKGYVYVPSPWWKTDYFEVRYEDQTLNRRFFYQLEGEGIRYEIVYFLKAIEVGSKQSYVNYDIEAGIIKVIEDFMNRKDFLLIQ